jgi:hypothetical protein
MVVAPSSKGGMIEKRWQPMSAAMWWGPSSCLDELGRGEDRPLRAADAEAGRPGGDFFRERREVGRRGAVRGAVLRGEQVGGVGAQEAADAVEQGLAGELAGEREQALALERRGGAGAVEDGGERLLEMGGLALLDHQDGVLAPAEGGERLRRRAGR